MSYRRIFAWRKNGVQLPERVVRKLLWLLTKLGQKTYRTLRRIFLQFFRKLYNHSAFATYRQKKQLQQLLTASYGLSDGLPKKSLVIALIIRDGTTYPKSSAFLRLISPLTDPSIKNKVTLKIYPDNTTVVESTIDVCIVQRTAFDHLRDAQKLVDYLKKTKIALIVDNDDGFQSIERNHTEYDIHSERIDALQYLVTNADQLWLSTTNLLEAYSTYTKPSKVVIENTLDPRFWTTLTKSNTKATDVDGPIQMLYMGTATHDADFEMILPALDQLAVEKPGSFHLTMIGVTSIVVERPWIKRIYQPRNGAIYPNFVPWFLKQGPYDIGLSPLVDSDFNRCKSDIKCLDYIAAGIVPVVSDVAPYSTPVLNGLIIRANNTPDSWKRELTTILNDPQGFRTMKLKIIKEGQDYIRANRLSKNASAKALYHLRRLK